jgi:hypothetical protein
MFSLISFPKVVYLFVLIKNLTFGDRTLVNFYCELQEKGCAMGYGNGNTAFGFGLSLLKLNAGNRKEAIHVVLHNNAVHD